MIVCDKCGYANNDGSKICLNCKGNIDSVSRQEKTESELYIRQREDVRKFEENRRKKVWAVMGCIAVIVAVCSGFWFTRVATAPSRGENIVREYLEDRIANVESVYFESTNGSCLKATDNSYLKGETIYTGGNVVINGRNYPFVANVSMKGVLDNGKVTSIKLAGVGEIVKN